jgi:hypothetical protein
MLDLTLYPSCLPNILLLVHLLICSPIPPVHPAIALRHLSKPLSEIIHVFALIQPSIGPGEDTIPLLLIPHPLALILIGPTRPLLPYALTIPQTVLEIPFEKGPT